MEISQPDIVFSFISLPLATPHSLISTHTHVGLLLIHEHQVQENTMNSRPYLEVLHSCQQRTGPAYSAI